MLVMSVELKTGDIISNVDKIDFSSENKLDLFFDNEEEQTININEVKSICML
jgi:hypothetical protein